MVSAFERALADYCGAKYAIAAANGTVTLQAALVALGVKPGQRVAVPPLTHAATTIAVLNVGAVPVFCDVDPETWLMQGPGAEWQGVRMPVSLYGLHAPSYCSPMIDDAAQTLRPFSRSREYGQVTGSYADFTSLSFQASKLLSVGEGGALLTDDSVFAMRARSYLSLGYDMDATQARIASGPLKSPTYDRHVFSPSINGRMNDVTATLGFARLALADRLKEERQECANLYRGAIAGCDWLTAQHVPDGWTHDYWTFAVATDTPERALWLSDAIVRHGGERPFPAWRLTYQEPAFAHLVNAEADVWDNADRPVGICPIAESLQPRLLQFQTNNLNSAHQNVRALVKAIAEAA